MPIGCKTLFMLFMCQWGYQPHYVSVHLVRKKTTLTLNSGLFLPVYSLVKQCSSQIHCLCIHIPKGSPAADYFLFLSFSSPASPASLLSWLLVSCGVFSVCLWPRVREEGWELWSISEEMMGGSSVTCSCVQALKSGIRLGEGRSPARYVLLMWSSGEWWCESSSGLWGSGLCWRAVMSPSSLLGQNILTCRDGEILGFPHSGL